MPRFCCVGRVLHVDYREREVRPVSISSLYAEKWAITTPSSLNSFFSKHHRTEHHYHLLNTTSSFEVLLYTPLRACACCLLRPPPPHHQTCLSHFLLSPRHQKSSPRFLLLESLKTFCVTSLRLQAGRPWNWEERIFLSATLRCLSPRLPERRGLGRTTLILGF